MANALSDKERALMDAYWRAANYLSVGQIYLYDNPLLKKPLAKEHIKPRLLGHWGTTPGLNFIYVHLNRLIKKHDLDMIYVTGAGHGGIGAGAIGDEVGGKDVSTWRQGAGGDDVLERGADPVERVPELLVLDVEAVPAGDAPMGPDHPLRQQ